MAKARSLIPVTLLIVMAVVLALGLLANYFILPRMSEEQLADNVLLNAIPFILIFVAILLAFIALIVVVARVLDNNISPRIHRIIETVLIAGIVLGVVSMFQPWLFAAFKYGFVLLLVSTLSFILWSHVTPRREAIEAEESLAEGVPSSLESGSGG
jgi:hypothetical protein